MRLCTLCNSSIGDEYHYLFECQNFCSSRKRLLKENYTKKHNINSFDKLMNINTTNKIEYKKLCQFFKEILVKFN